MSGRGRVAVVVAALAAVVGLFFVLRSGGDDAAVPATNEDVTAPATTATVETAPPPPPGPVRARITVRGGEVAGGRRLLKVQQGKRMVLIVDADVADHVHLHGYDLMRDVAPGSPARIRFRATLTGRFEVELEDRGLQIAEIEVRP